MSKYFVIMSFELHSKNQLNDWQALSKKIDADIAQADGFISRDSGVDEAGRVYCLVKWQSKAHQENFRKKLEAGENWDEMMAHFNSIANMETSQIQNVDVF